MEFNKYFIDIIKNKYVDFSGRAGRKEYWMFTLFYILVAIAVSIVDTMLSLKGMLSTLFALGMFLPSLAISVRRMHDIGKSWVALLINLIPLAGFIIFIIWLARDSAPGTNKYGPNPKGV